MSAPHLSGPQADRVRSAVDLIAAALLAVNQTAEHVTARDGALSLRLAGLALSTVGPDLDALLGELGEARVGIFDEAQG